MEIGGEEGSITVIYPKNKAMVKEAKADECCLLLFFHRSALLSCNRETYQQLRFGVPTETIYPNISCPLKKLGAFPILSSFAVSFQVTTADLRSAQTFKIKREF